MYKRLSKIVVLSVSLLFLASCSTPIKIEPLPEEKAFSLTIAIDKLADNLLKQLKNKEVSSTILVYNTFIDIKSGQTLEMSLDIERIFLNKTRSYKEFEVLSFEPENLTKASYIIDGFVRLETRKTDKNYRIYAAIIDLKNKKVMANGKIWLRKQRLNIKPTQSSKDSPMYSTDLKTLISAVTTNVEQNVIAEYFRFLGVDAGTSKAEKLYNSGKFQEAFDICKDIEQKPNGKRVRTYKCLYITSFASKNLLDAEKYFYKLISEAVRENEGSIPVNIVFELASTEFYNSPELLQQFDIWLKQVASYLKTNRKKCVYVFGHSSVSSYNEGQKERNCKLSKKRAESIRKKIQQISPFIGRRLRAVGKGSENCRLCTVPDDEEGGNAIDRKVEFKVVSCNSSQWRRPEKSCSF